MSKPKCPLSQTFLQRAELLPDSVAIISHHHHTCSKQLTYNQLLDEARGVAAALTAFGTSSPIVLTASLTASFFSAWWGAILAGVPVLLEHPNDPPDRLIKNRAAAGVGGALRLIGEGSSLQYVVEPLAGIVPLPTDAAVLITTSGSSGKPKIISLTPQQLLASASRVNERLSVTADSVWLLSLMPAHIGGLSIIIRAMVGGCTVVIPNDLKRHRLHQLTHEHAVTHLSLVPSVAEEFFGIGPMPDSLQVLLLGGERITTAQRKALASIPECYISYGATETASCIAVARLSEVADLPNSVGFPLSDTLIQIRDERGDLCSMNEPGTVEISGPTISGEKYDSHSGHPIWRSTDRGYIDNSGMLHILGRTDEVIISGGVKISANEIVDAAIATNLVTEAAVIKAPDNQWGEKAILFATAPTTTSAETLYEKLRKSLGAPRAPREIIILFSFPRTAIGKIDRSALKLYGSDLTREDGTFSTLVSEKFLR